MTVVNAEAEAVIEVPVEVMEVYAAGHMTLVEVANHVGCSPTTAMNSMLRQGYVLRRRGRPRQYTLPEGVGMEHAEGKITIAQIAERIGCSLSTVSKLLQETRKACRDKLHCRRREVIRDQREQRAAEIFAGYKKSKSLKVLGAEFGISGERVRQIVNARLAEQYHLDTHSHIRDCDGCNREMVICGTASGRPLSGKVFCPDCWENRKRAGETA